MAMEARQEELGDLKLYRIPEPVSVAARSQKQVALLQRPSVKVTTLYRLRLYPGAGVMSAMARRVLVTRNRTAEGLGLPLPSGRMMVFGEGAARPILLGMGVIRDRAVGEDVEVDLGDAPAVRVAVTPTARSASASDYRLEISNDRDRPIRFEAEIVDNGYRLSAPGRLIRRNGMSVWTVTLPANGRASLSYTLEQQRRP
jgi:hypothetical protein